MTPEPRSATRQIARSVERTLHNEARRNELLIAYTRVLATMLMACMDSVSYVYPQLMQQEQIPLWMPLISCSAACIAIIIMLILRSGLYRGWLRYLFPAIDGVVISLAFLGARFALGTAFFKGVGGLGTIGITCSLLAASGALRLTRSAAVFTAAVAIISFVVASWGLMELTPNYGILVGLLAAFGALSVWITGIVNRAVKSEVGRAMLTRFLPQRVIDDAHTDPMGLVTQPRSVDATVVVTDLRGFTAFSESLSPDEVLTFLNEVQGALARVVRTYGGTVDKFMGDGMLAVFGVPEELDDHALRAICAASEMLRVIERINLQRRDRQPVRLGIGVHSGAVVAGCLGSGLRLEFTIIGDTVNTASRLESLTKEKGVTTLISDDTTHRVGSAFSASGTFQGSAVADALLRARQADAQLRREEEGDDRPRADGDDEDTVRINTSTLELPRLELLGEVSIRGRVQPMRVHTLFSPPPSQTRLLTRDAVSS